MHESPTAAENRCGDDEVALILALGKALHAYGAPSPRLEHALELLSKRFGLQGQFFATPTAIFAAFGPEGAQRTSLMRVSPGEVDLGKRVGIDELISDVLQRRVGTSEALARLERLLSSPDQTGAAWTVLCFGLASLCAARFFGGGWNELAVAFFAGCAVSLLSFQARRRENLRRAFEPLTAFAVSGGATLAAHWIAPLSTYTVTVSGLIVLLPGLSLTSAMSELAARHLASGTARLMGGALTFLTLGFGVAVGRTLGEWLPPAAPGVASTALPAWTLAPALVIAPICFGVLLRARPRDWIWIVAVCIAAFFGARVGADWFGPGIGAALGAFVVGTTSNGLSRIFDRSSAVTVVPGILMLVPGSIGFQSLSSLLARDVVSGVETGFTMALVAVSLVAGLLLANAVVPPRRLETESA